MPPSPKEIENAGDNKWISPLDNGQREIAIVPTGAFVATMAMVPIWAATVLPLSIAYQIGKAAYDTVAGPSVKPWSYEDSGTPLPTNDGESETTNFVPLAQRKFDVVVMGASGFTGGLAVRHLALQYGVSTKSKTNEKIQWAIAGRSEKKLQALLEKWAKEWEMPEMNEVPIIVVDTSNPSTMPGLVAETRAVATTAGPYSLYGSSVVEFCAKFGTHYVDITGELEWVKQMALRYQETAKKTGSKIVSFCGHDSIPWDLLTLRLEDTISKHGQPNSGEYMTKVTYWDQTEGDFAGGTLATMMAVIDGKIPPSPSKDVDVTRFQANGSPSLGFLRKVLPALPASEQTFDVDHGSDMQPDEKAKKGSRWSIPFMMADVNADVVSWSEALRSSSYKVERTLDYTEKWVVPDFKTAMTMYCGVIMGVGSLLNPLTRNLIEQSMTQPGSGPKMDAMEKNHYLMIAAEGVGSAGTKAHAMMYFSKDVGCLETSRMLVESGLCLALDARGKESKLPATEGGFWTPSTAMGENLLDRILNDDTTLQVRVLPSDSQ